MLKGHVFSLQTFGNECFALFIHEFLGGNSGVVKGCKLSNTTNSVTISSGYFVIQGRFLQIIDNESISNITNDGYYSLICEVDLSKTNTIEQLNQAIIKLISNSSAYPTLTKQNLNDGVNIYQFEFARFRVQSGSITNFTDTREFLNFESIYDEIRTIIEGIEDESIFVLKSGGTIDGNLEVTGNIISDSITDINRQRLFK